jgi:hypothetical protein
MLTIYLVIWRLLLHSDVNLGIFKNTSKRSKCNSEPFMSIVKRKKSPEVYYWTCKRPCTYTCTIRKNSSFENYKITMRSIFKIIYKYINGVSFVDIAFDLSLDRDTSSNVANLIREVICEYTSENNEMLGGINDDGTSRIVEINESFFFKRKHNRGRT